MMSQWDGNKTDNLNLFPRIYIVKGGVPRFHMPSEAHTHKYVYVYIIKYVYIYIYIIRNNMEVEGDIWEMGGELQERELEILLKYILL